MEIKIKDYTLRSDKFSMWIEKDGNRIAGYCQSFNRLLEDFMDKAVKESDAKTVEEALAILDKATEEAKQIAKAAYKGDFKIVRSKESEGK